MNRNTSAFIHEIRQLIARDELPSALEQLRALLDNSPKLEEAIYQSGRFQYIRRQIRLGVVSHAEATLTENQIRFGLLDFDYLNLLLLSTDFLNKEGCFAPEIHDFTAELSDTESDLYKTALFLDRQRRRWLENGIPKNEQLPTLLDEYLTGQVFWLRQISFLAKYRLVSV